MIQWIISSSALMVIVLSLRKALKSKLSLRLRYLLWLPVLIRLLIPISFGETQLSVMNALPNPAAAQSSALVGTAASFADMPAFLPQTVPSDPSAAQESFNSTDTHIINYRSISKSIYISGIAVFGLWFISCNLSYYIHLVRSAKRVRITNFPLKVYALKWIETPCLFGLFKPSVYITPQVLEDGTKLRHVLAHELTHFRHMDHIWSYLRGIAVILHWYNPIVWLCAGLSKRDCELACDESVIMRLGEDERTAYGDTLIGLTVKKHSPASVLSGATTMISGKSAIYERISLIAKRPKTAVFALIILLAGVMIASACTFTGAQKDPALVLSTPENAQDTLASLITAPTQTPNKSNQTQDPAIMTLTCAGQTVEPYLQMKWENKWVGDDWLYASGKPLDLASIEEDIPEIAFDGSYSVDFPFGGRVYSVALYNDDLTLKTFDDDLYYYGSTVLYWLDPGTYYAVFDIAGPNGKYIESENQYEAKGYHAAVKLKVEKNTNEPFDEKKLKSNEIISAHMTVLGTTYTANADALAKLNELFKTCKKTSPSGCPFSTLMYLTLSDGSTCTLCPAEDSCNVFTSDGLFYELESKRELTVWDILDIKRYWTEEEFDENGNVVKSQEFSWGTLSAVVENTYTDSGLIASSKRILADGWTSETIYTYDSNGRLTEKLYLTNNELNSSIVYTYNELDQLIEEISYLEGDQKYITRTYKYNDIGQKESMAYFNHADSGNYLEVYDYDKRGQMISKTTYDAIKDGKFSHRYEYFHTDSGQLSQMYYYGDKNKLEAIWKYEYDADFPDTRLVYSYDGKNNFIETYREALDND